MKLPIIPGLVALQLAAALTASAQNYYIKLSGDYGTRIADHGSWEQGATNFNESIEAYNVQVSGGGNGIGLMRFYGPGASYSWAVHHRLDAAPEEVEARRILVPQYNNMLYVIGEKFNGNGSGTKSAVVLQYDVNSGALTAAHHLPALPQGYNLIRVYDVISEPDFQNRMRILCKVSNGSAETIVELLYNANNNSYTVKRYKPINIALDKYTSAYYVRAYHYGTFNLGERSFYGMGTYSGERIAYCYAENKIEMYQLQSANGSYGITGVQMNGSYGADGTHRRIDMAFIDREGALCIQQKDELNILNWRRFYTIPKATFEMGYGRDGHGTKAGGGMDYFMAATHFPGDANSDGHVTSLHYNALNGNLNKPQVYNLSGIGVQKGGGFPNTIYDPQNKYSFIADRFNQLNGFKYGINTPTSDGDMPCNKPVAVKELHNILKEKQDEVDAQQYGPYLAEEIVMVAVNDITVDIVAECDTEQRSLTSGDNSFQGSSNLYMDANRMRLEATGKTITAMRVLSVDGRLIAEQRNLSSSRYEQHFNTPLTPGIYVVSLEYADHSRENRKISVH